MAVEKKVCASESERQKSSAGAPAPLHIVGGQPCLQGEDEEEKGKWYETEEIQRDYIPKDIMPGPIW